jgi:hypothetical protein
MWRPAPTDQEAIVHITRRTVISVLTAVALLAGGTTASAHNRADAPTSSLAGTTTPRQDLRGEHARDAARADEIAAQMRSFKPAPLVAPKPAPAATPSAGTPWAVIGISLFTVLVATGGAVLYVRASRRTTLARS